MAKETDTKETRYHIEKDGTRRKIVDSYYDPQRNYVIDEYEVERIVRNSEKKPVKVITRRRAASQNKELQKKYHVPANATRMEVKLDE